MKQKIWITNIMYPTIYTDDSKTDIDFTRNKSNVTVPNHSRVFTDKGKMEAYVASYENTVGIVSVCEDEIEINSNEVNNDEMASNKIDNEPDNSRLIPYYKDHLFAVIELSEYKEQTNGSVTAIFVSEKNAKKYADELLYHLNAEKHRTVVKSYRVLVQPIPKEDIEKPGVNTPVTDGWYLPPKK